MSSDTFPAIVSGEFLSAFSQLKVESFAPPLPNSLLVLGIPIIFKLYFTAGIFASEHIWIISHIRSISMSRSLYSFKFEDVQF